MLLQRYWIYFKKKNQKADVIPAGINAVIFYFLKRFKGLKYFFVSTSLRIMSSP